MNVRIIIALSMVWMLGAMAGLACSRQAAIRNATDAARAVCCYAHIKEGKTPEAAEIACRAVEAIAPFISKTEQAATPAKVGDSGRKDAGHSD